jgi:hypothetical protein
LLREQLILFPDFFPYDGPIFFLEQAVLPSILRIFFVKNRYIKKVALLILNSAFFFLILVSKHYEAGAKRALSLSSRRSRSPTGPL